ncbi:MAG: ectonucleotide pyrophosphatase/phosphodiesterase [Ignavibacteriaceae bacterium]
MKKNIFFFSVIFLSLLAFSPVPAQSDPYVILISFDGFRWDYPLRGITPVLDSLSNEGSSALSLESCFPSKTFPNHYSIITGQYPVNHGIVSNVFKDFRTGRTFAMWDETQKYDPSWYNGEAFWETAEKNSILSASFFWPGSEINDSIRRPAYFKYYDHEKPYLERIQGVIEWLKLPYNKRPHFITVYFDAADTYGHSFGPDSDQLNQSLQLLDSLLSIIIGKVRNIGLADSTDFIVVSDHGMTPVSNDRIINVDEILDGIEFESVESGPVMFIKFRDEFKMNGLDKLKQPGLHFGAYTNQNLPQHWHYDNNQYLGDVLLVAEPGWSLIRNDSSGNPYKLRSKGAHGYDNHFLDMHGIFYAVGPHFKKGYRTGTLKNIDIYPLLCKIFKISPDHKIDGDINRIGFILNTE